MCYANPILARGLERFARRARRRRGQRPDRARPAARGGRPRCARPADARGLALVPLVAPTTPAERLARIGAGASGFLYTVSVTGTTGERARRSTAARRPSIARAAAHTDVPVAVGFGISTPEQAAAAARRRRRRRDRRQPAGPGRRRGRRIPRPRSASWCRTSRQRCRAGARLGSAVAMGLILTATAGLCIWIVIWSLNVSGLDAILIAIGDGADRDRRSQPAPVPARPAGLAAADVGAEACAVSCARPRAADRVRAARPRWRWPAAARLERATRRRSSPARR